MIAATIALHKIARISFNWSASSASLAVGTHKMPSPSKVTNPSLTLSFKFKVQNMQVEKTARYRSVAELKATTCKINIES